MDAVIEKIDQFRFISQTHTTVRQLIICSKILKIIGKKHLPLNFLQLNLVNWSKEMEANSPAYKKCRGKITDGGKQTTSFKHYIKLLQALGLLVNVNSIVSLTRSASILLTYLPDKNDYAFRLTSGETLFYFYFIMREDADVIISVLQELSGFNDNINQKDLLNELLSSSDGSFENRLVQKQNLSSGLVKSFVGEKVRKISFEWRKKEVYAEHIFVPRFEWLNQLGVISILSNAQTFYRLQSSALDLINAIPVFKGTDFKDVNEDWFEQKFMYSYSLIQAGDIHYKFYSDRRPTDIDNAIGEGLFNAFNQLGAQASLRMPLLATELFVIFGLAIERNIIIEISELYNILENGFNYNSKVFLAKKSARLSESYITISHL